MTKLDLDPGLVTFIEEQLARNNICAMRLTSLVVTSGEPFWTGDWSWYFPDLYNQSIRLLYQHNEGKVMGVDTNLNSIKDCAGDLLSHYIGRTLIGASNVRLDGFENLTTDLVVTKTGLQRQLTDYWYPRLLHHLSEFQPGTERLVLSEITAGSPTSHKNLALIYVNLIGYQCILGTMRDS